jgi:hypothetical protein
MASFIDQPTRAAREQINDYSDIITFGGPDISEVGDPL